LLQGKQSRVKMVHTLLEQGADPNIWDSSKQRTAVHLAMQYGQHQVLLALLDHNCLRTARTANSETGLHCVVRGLQKCNYTEETSGVECIKLLLKGDLLKV
jgi:ankyrin repeat protein